MSQIPSIIQGRRIVYEVESCSHALIVDLSASDCFGEQDRQQRTRRTVDTCQFNVSTKPGELRITVSAPLVTHGAFCEPLHPIAIAAASGRRKASTMRLGLKNLVGELWLRATELWRQKHLGPHVPTAQSYSRSAEIVLTRRSSLGSVSNVLSLFTFVWSAGFSCRRTVCKLGQSDTCNCTRKG